MDPTAKVTYDRDLLNELVSIRFIEAHRHVTVVGPVGVGKTFVAHALGHIACRNKLSVLALRADRLLKALKHARLDHSCEAELRNLLAVHSLIVDDFALDAMDATESRDVHEILTERDRAGSIIHHLEPWTRRVAGHLRRSHPRSSRHRPLQVQRL